MKIFGFDISRANKDVGGYPAPLRDGGNWISVVKEANTGWWQRNITLSHDTVLSHNAVFACMSLISADISKLRIKLMRESDNGVGFEVSNSPAFGPVLRKPNSHQNRIQFLEEWVLSKLTRGNAYIIKERDQRGVVVGLRVLHPDRCKVLVTPDGEIYYQVNVDNLAKVPIAIDAVPASEIIHDRYMPLFHPMVGLSPLFAASLSATEGLNIQRNSAQFFAQGAMPSGILTAPEHIDKETAVRIKEHWDQRYNGSQVGRVAILGDGLQYKAMTMTAVDAQLIEQRKYTAEMICAAFKVPSYMAGFTPPPTHTNVEAMNQQYYTQCLQAYIESIEECLNDGIGIGMQNNSRYYCELDLEGLIRMDGSTKVQYWTDLTKGGVAKLNEARAAFGFLPVDGGDSVFMQEQMWPLSELNKRQMPTTPPPAAPATLPTPEPSKSQEWLLTAMEGYFEPLPPPDDEAPAVLMGPPELMRLTYSDSE